MLYEEYIKTNKEAFLSELRRICALLHINPDDLMLVMYAESRLNPQARNPITRATGLIQFMPSTARALGTNVDALVKMSNVQQLTFVYKYFLPYRGKINSVYDVYKAVFFPAMLGKPKTWVLQTADLTAQKIAEQNKIIDSYPRDGRITVGEFETYVESYLKKKV